GLPWPAAVAQDFIGDGALAGDDEGIVEGMNEGEAGFRYQRVAMYLGVAVAVANEYHLGAHRADSIHLDRGRRLRHDDDRPYAQAPRGVGDALCMIARAGGDDAASALVLGQVRHAVVGAAQLEAEDRLLVFALEQHRVPEASGQPRREIERRLARDVVDAARQDVVEQPVNARRA